MIEAVLLLVNSLAMVLAFYVGFNVGKNNELPKIPKLRKGSAVIFKGKKVKDVLGE